MVRRNEPSYIVDGSQTRVPEYGMQGDNDCPMFVATGIWGLREFAKESRNMHASIGRVGVASIVGWRGWLCGSNVSSDSSPR